MNRLLKASIGLNIAAIAICATSFGMRLWKLNEHSAEQEQATLNYSTSAAYQEVREEADRVLANESNHLNETLTQFGEESAEYQQAAATYNQLNTHYSSHEYFMECLKQNEQYYAPYKAAETSKNWDIAIVALMGALVAANAGALGGNIRNAQVEKKLNEVER